MTQYPEHDRARAINQESQAIGEFIDSLSGYGLYLCDKQTKTHCRSSRKVKGHFWDCENGRMIENVTGEDFGPCPDCDGTGEVPRLEPLYLPAHVDIQKLLARHFMIDLDKLEEEKRAMLDALREANQ